MTLRTEAMISFYLLHTMLLNVSLERRQKHIQSDRTVYAYRPVQFDAVSKSSTNGPKMDGENAKRCRYLSTFYSKSTSRKYWIQFRKSQEIRIFWLECDTSDNRPFLASLDNNLLRRQPSLLWGPAICEAWNKIFFALSLLYNPKEGY